MAQAAKRKSVNLAKPGGKDPFLHITPLKDVFHLFADRRTKLLPLAEVPFVLRACGLTIYSSEEQKIKEEVEKIDGLGKPVSFKTLNDWMEENLNRFDRPYAEAYDAVSTLCQEGIIGNTSVIKAPYLRHLVGELGDKIPAKDFNKILEGETCFKDEQCSVDDFITFLQK